MVAWEPLRLLDATGSVLAQVGDTVTVTGPSGGVGFTPCGPGAVPFVVEVISGPGGNRSFRDGPTREPWLDESCGERSSVVGNVLL
jgi:hypothetical protein